MTEQPTPPSAPVRPACGYLPQLAGANPRRRRVNSVTGEIMEPDPEIEDDTPLRFLSNAERVEERKKRAGERRELTGAEWIAVARYAATDDSRPVLAGVMIDLTGVSAADGFRLVKVEAPVDRSIKEGADMPAPRSCIIPAGFFLGPYRTLIAKAARLAFVIDSNGAVYVRVEPLPRRGDPKPLPVFLETSLVEGTFPDFDQILQRPDAVTLLPHQGPGSPVVAAFNAEYVADAAALAKAFWNGAGLPAIVFETWSPLRAGFQIIDHGPAEPYVESAIMPIEWS